MALDRRSFIKVAGAQAGLIATAPSLLDASLAERRPPAFSSAAPDVVVIGAGAWGGWTAYYLQSIGANVTLVDQYGPGNSRSTSGDETRGIRSAYAQKEHWTRWAREAIHRWQQWDDEFSRPLGTRLFFPTSDVILRAEWEPFLDDTQKVWDTLGVPYEKVTADEVKYRYPVIGTDDMTVALIETEAGVVRARRSCEMVAEVFRRRGGRIELGRASPGTRVNGVLSDVAIAGGTSLKADQFVFACGPWMPKALPDVMTNKLRVPLGYVFYYGVPPEDPRFAYPHMPSWNFPGVTGWAALPPDHRGFRVRGGGGTGPGQGEQDPDLSNRYMDPASFDRARAFVALRFPLLKDAPIVQTHACHYESNPNRDFIVDTHPELSNVWLAGGGNAEGFKMGPVIGEYVAHRLLGMPTDPALTELFRLTSETFAPPTAPGAAPARVPLGRPIPPAPVPG